MREIFSNSGVNLNNFPSQQTTPTEPNIQILCQMLQATLSPDMRWCPICEKYAPSFKPYGIISRPHAQCPNCSSLERHRLMWLLLKNETDLFDMKDKSLLHFAPEPCFLQRLSAVPNLRYVTADIEPGQAEVIADIQNLQFENHTFNAVICSHVLEHIPDDIAAIKELFRVIKPGGWALIVVPMLSILTTLEDPNIVTNEERMKHYGSPEHVRMYGQDIVFRLCDAGFTVERYSQYAASILPSLKERMSLASDVLFLCRIPHL